MPASTGTMHHHLTHMLQATAIGLFCVAARDMIPVLTHNSRLFEAGTENPAYKNYTASMRVNEQVLWDHFVNNTWDPDDHLQFAPRTVEVDRLLTKLIISALTFPLYYLWHIWLEHKWPRLPAPVAVDEKSKLLFPAGGEPSELWEEQVIEYLVAQGKVQCLSFNIGNTLHKWVLGMIFDHVAGIVIQALVWNVLGKRLFPAENYAAAISGVDVFRMQLSTRPEASLLVMALVPAEHRVSAIEGIGALQTIFYVTIAQPFFRLTSFGEKWYEMQTQARWVTALSRGMVANFDAIGYERFEMCNAALRRCSKRLSECTKADLAARAGKWAPRDEL